MSGIALSPTLPERATEAHAAELAALGARLFTEAYAEYNTPEDLRQARGLTARQGALVAEVVPRSPAAAAGLQPGDVIVAFQGEPVANPHDLTRRVAATPPGTAAKLELLRNGARQNLEARLARLPDTDGGRGR